MYDYSETVFALEQLCTKVTNVKLRLDRQALETVALATWRIERNLHADGLSLNSDQYQKLALKLYLYCVERTWTTQEAAWQLEHVMEPITQMIARRPGHLASEESFVGLLDNRAHNKQRAQAMLNTWMGDRSPRRFVMATCDPDYALEELLTPYHLLEESAALGHCAGTSFNSDVLQKKNLLEYDINSPTCLHWWVRMHSGQNRVFSLRHRKNGPAATIAFEKADRAIVEMEGGNRILYGDEPFFPALCDAVGGLIDSLNVRIIKNGIPLPPDRERTLLTRYHGWVSQETALRRFKPKDIITGVMDFVAIPPGTVRDAWVQEGRIFNISTFSDFMTKPPWIKKDNLVNDCVPTRPARRIPMRFAHQRNVVMKYECV